jgi:hypothetical protein
MSNTVGSKQKPLDIPAPEVEESLGNSGVTTLESREVRIAPKSEPITPVPLRNLPLEIKTQLKRWEWLFIAARMTHILLGLLNTTSFVIIAGWAGVLLPSTIVALAATAALCSALQQALRPGSKANQYRKAWIELFHICNKYKYDLTITESDLFDTVRRGEEIMGELEAGLWV